MFCTFINTVLTEYGMTFYKEAKSDFDVIQNK